MSDEEPAGHKKDTAGRTFTVLLALAANLAVGLLKLVAGLISGSGALLSEAAHSVGDCTTEVLLLVALRRSDRPADRLHPFGYGKERYFWSLLAAGAIFVSGAAFSIYQGLHTIFGPPESTEELWINYPVLALAFILEGTSFLQALRKVRQQSRSQSRSIVSLFRAPEDPTTNSVAMEDAAALIGLALAGAGVGLHQLTGNALWDGFASILIGGLLLFVAYVLAHACQELLIGKQADPRLLRAIETRLEEEREIEDVVDLLTMLTGAGKVLVCVRADFADEVSAGQMEDACARIDEDLREKFPQIDEFFIQPVSSANPDVRERVVARYGRVLADE